MRFFYCLMILILITGLHGQNRPFPQALNYPNTIKPSHVSQTSMNTAVAAYYDYWKTAYLRPSNGNTPGGYFVFYEPFSGYKTVSEAHGYGMIIMALMAGQEDSAKVYFDGMYHMYRDHPSQTNNHLMSWIISDDENPAQGDNNATDGDMDIAYALLLANDQWGSGGDINYLAEAQRIINNGLKASNTNNHRTMLGDWWIFGSWDWGTRSSDWMPGHFRAYQAATGDHFWNEMADTVYSLIDRVSAAYSPITGLMPDFIDGHPPAPAPPFFLESEFDGAYNWNACRFPWRIAADYAHYGTNDAKTALNKILTWLKGDTGNNPGNIKPGYHLDGSAIPNRPYTATAYIAPMVAACIVDANHQIYLNIGWNNIVDNQEGYYSDTVNLLCMLLISGNWWSYNSNTTALPVSPTIPSKTELIGNYPNPFNPTTNIGFRIAGFGFVELEIYDVTGRMVKTLVNENLAAGSYTVQWNATNNAGQKVGSGLYFYKIQAGELTQVRRMMLIK